MAETASATYGNDPTNSPLDMVRLLVGDTDCATALCTDQEIEFYLESEGDASWAAPCVATAMAAKVARQTNVNAGGVSQNLSDLFTHYMDLAKSLRVKAASAVDVWAGGLSVAEKQADKTDSDLVQPYFERGQMHNPLATDKPPQGDLSGRKT